MDRESAGLQEAVQEVADAQFLIPMQPGARLQPGARSLNVAMEAVHRVAEAWRKVSVGW
jgi:tRNA(Leu) C34 or U34 (ribose-2'-O)-methylase TrmL